MPSSSVVKVCRECGDELESGWEARGSGLCWCCYEDIYCSDFDADELGLDPEEEFDA